MVLGKALRVARSVKLLRLGERRADVDIRGMRRGHLPSARIGAAAVVAHPQADEVALAVRFWIIDERGAAVPERAVVDKLDLAWFEIEIDRQSIVLEDLEHGVERRPAFGVDRLAAHRVSA